ncbi:protoporphyrinogen oxidase [Epidermidibacterium keratini]|uniref:Coproporphyrinogen III oxidase n=1 Tax=Epidermidibacterium keratini TaxID=1891644 RepID=A0A7L4YU28_9ACTN|nr:protoporphyrinogen oxidase [Epidermidibacterium keratini]QHC01977.1 protoporphyrinogen oxidase [Epidermidibacterium keratini]
MDRLDQGTLPRRCDVLVIGAGVSGLAAARDIQRAQPELDVQIIDVAPQAGGKLRSGELAGVRIDLGAEAVIARRPEGLALIEDLALGEQVHHPGPGAAQVLGSGGPVGLPADTLMGVPSSVESVAASGVLSDAGLQRLESAVAGGELGDDASVAEVIGGQLGSEVVDRLVEPLLAGVYAGRADRLSLRATIPPLWAALQHSSNVIDAVGAVRRNSPSQSGPVFATVDGGIGSLPAAMISRDDLAVSLGTAARSIERTADGFAVAVGAVPEHRAIQAGQVVVATQPQKASRLLADVAPLASRELADVATSSMAVIALAFRRSDLDAAPSASGLLIPVSAGTAVKAFTFVTTKWPHLTDDYVIVRASIGRVGEDVVLQRDDTELVESARADLAALTGITAAPVDAVVQRWAGSLPQYDVGHLARVERIRAAVDAVPGLAVAGATYDGVGIPGCLNSAAYAAQQIIEHHRIQQRRYGKETS